MSERYDDPNFYDHVFYPKGIWVILFYMVIAPFVAIGQIFLMNYMEKIPEIDWKFVVVIGIALLIFEIFALFFIFNRFKKMSVGIGRGGVYVRGFGMQPWSKIKKIYLVWHPKYKRSIKVKMFSTFEEGQEVSWLEKISRAALHFSRDEPDSIFIQKPSENLFVVLKTYYDKFKQEKKVGEDFWVETKEKFLPKEKDIVKRLPIFWIKVVGAILLIVGFATYSFIKGERGVTFLISFGVSIFASIMALFITPLIIFMTLASITLIIFGLVFFIYFLIWEGRFDWNPLFVVAGGCYFLLVILLVSRKEKKMKK